MAKNDGMQVDPVFIDQPHSGEAMGQLWTRDLDLSRARCLEVTDGVLQISAD
jgi:hypothetical protein